MDEEFAPLRFCTTGPDYITVRSRPRTGYIPLHLLPLLPHILLVPRDLAISSVDLDIPSAQQEPVFESTHIISLLRGELDDAEAARVEKLLKNKGVVGLHFPLHAIAICDNKPSPSGDSDTYYASSALLALRETSMQSPENELPSEAELTR